MSDTRAIAVTGSLVAQLRKVADAEQVAPQLLVDAAVRECIRAYRPAPLARRYERGDGVFYRGPSLLTGEPIVGVMTGLNRASLNTKTGPMVQTWILRPDMAPMDAVRENRDDAICGDCALRGDGGRDRRCYVAPWVAPNNVWRVLDRNELRDLSWSELRAGVRGHSVRLGAYGDPAAIPFETWGQFVTAAAGWIGYTHQWRRCDPRFRAIVMASVDSVAEFRAAQRYGWRTFRVLPDTETVLQRNECRCPASDEMQHRTTCERCQLCRGQSRPARSIAIVAHGHNGVMTAFYRSRDDAANTRRT